jgi:putative protease
MIIIFRSLMYRNVLSEQETEIGSVMTYYNQIGVAVIELTGNVKTGDKIIFRGYTTDLEHVIDNMEIEHQSVQEAKAGDQIGIKVGGRVRKKDKVYK